MKKFKMILSAVAIVTIVGSAIAFTTKAPILCYYKKNASGACPEIANPVAATDIGAGNEYVGQRDAQGQCPPVDPAVCVELYDLDFN